MEFVRDNQLGIFERNISKLPGIIRDLCLNEQKYEMYRSNIRQIGLKNGTKEVGEFLQRGEKEV
jgi:processive 1,2-diacylglycerol beta-glucosyltransferase/1,2-diacylglycerol 3-beta-galactosyltransferase